MFVQNKLISIVLYKITLNDIVGLVLNGIMRFKIFQIIYFCGEIHGHFSVQMGPDLVSFLVVLLFRICT